MSIVERAMAELGYKEKSKAAYDIYGVSCLWPKDQYSGYDNFTKYAVIAGYPNGQPWCQTFVNAIFKEEYGEALADKLLCGKLRSASTMEVKDAMLNAGREVSLTLAMAGDLVFRKRSGGGHVGIVAGTEAGKIVTIEGNTSSLLEDWNGGTVARHVGASWDWCCRPDWRLLIDTSWHWVNDRGIWYYQDAAGNNSFGWRLIGETERPEVKHWYYFAGTGAMLTGAHEIEGQIYYLMEAGPLEGACCLTDSNGALSPWYIIK